jgi:asparagine synthase (glutamine-hydrolysing)
MCGIAGFYNVDQPEPVLHLALSQMVAALRHRGPDGNGLHIEGNVGLGHARLSIVDLAGGRQPMSADADTLWVTFNGEIFNYVELREELLARGRQLQTRSDTETILHLYAEKGASCVDDFNGDFAFALWDKKENRLLLARDRMGVRPLYYTHFNGGLVFASEMDALLRFPGLHAELDPQALDQCFTFWLPVAPRTPFRGIHELPPGHVLMAQGSQITVRPYWQLTFPTAAEHQEIASRADEDQIAEELHALLLDATRIRLRADVPVGAYLSGGLDSSVLTALCRQCAPGHLRTFSVGFDSDEFDETPFQQAVVQALQTDHEAILCTPSDISASFPEVVRHAGQPLLRTAPAPLYRLARAVRDSQFKVVLTGEGADEILGGYDLFKEAKIRRFWSRQPQSTWRPSLLRRLYPYLAGVNGQPQAALEAFFRIGMETPDDPFFSHLPRWSTTGRIKGLFSAELKSALAERNAQADLRETLPSGFAAWHPLSQAQYLETLLLLPGYLLSAQGDRVMMAHGVEGRFPFLDHRVVEFCAKIPPRLKMNGLKEKYILRRSMAGTLPESILNRTKQPYRAPDNPCFSGATAPEYARELLSPDALRDAGYFDANAVSKLVEKCRRQTAVSSRDGMALTGALSVQLLHQFYIRRSALK